jgi:hypothetical protein
MEKFVGREKELEILKSLSLLKNLNLLLFTDAGGLAKHF